MGVLYLIFGLIIFLTLTAIIWRFSSRRMSLPCPAWLGWLVELDNPLTKINQAATIIHHLNIQPGMTVLDVGCGPGRLAIPLAHKVGPKGEIVAMDIQTGMLDKVKKKAQVENLTNISFFHSGIGVKKLKNEYFDRALLVTVLGEIPNREMALKEIFDTLKPGGVLSITEIIFDPHYQRFNTVLQLTSAIGFRKREVFKDRFAFTLNLEKAAR